jgi:hypothetical protein
MDQQITPLSILKYECELRKSDEIQELYDDYDGVLEDYIQERVIAELNLNCSLNDYREMIGMVIDDPIIRENVFYLKYNIMKEKTINKFVDVPLITMDQSNIMLSSLMKNKPLIIFAGSIT